MSHPNLEVINRFFEAYSNRNMNDLRLVLADNARWIFLGQTSCSGISEGFDEVIDFFDIMGAITSRSNSRVEKLISCADDNYVIECLRVWANSEDGDKLDHLVCVLWKIENSKIVEGRHFFADPAAADNFISYISSFE